MARVKRHPEEAYATWLGTPEEAPWRLAYPDGTFVRDDADNVLRFELAVDALEWLDERDWTVYHPWEDS